jgi:hypothetical protein
MNPAAEWTNLLIDSALARSYRRLVGEHIALRLPEVESITVSGLLIRSMSLLDEAVEGYIAERGILVAERSPKLFHRLRALREAGLLVNYDDIDSWRVRRNDVGHKVADTYRWEELDACHVAIYRELSHLSILSAFPRFEVTKTTERVPPSSPNVSLEQNIRVSVAADGVVAHELHWRLQA